MNTKLKIGDRVKIIECTGPLKHHQGLIGKIVHLFEDGEVTVQISDTIGCIASKVELLPKKHTRKIYTHSQKYLEKKGGMCPSCGGILLIKSKKHTKKVKKEKIEKLGRNYTHTIQLPDGKNIVCHEYFEGQMGDKINQIIDYINKK